MKKLIVILFAFIPACYAFSQKKAVSGTVSYVTSQSIYVKFQSTSGIEAGDTLYFADNGQRKPALVVQNLSSISCVCKPINDRQFKVGDAILANIPKKEEKEEKPESPVTNQEEDVAPLPETIVEEGVSKKEKEEKQRLYGRLSVSSYSNFVNEEDGNSHRMRYIASLNGENLGGGKLGFESYIAFSHRDEEWDLIKANIYEGLKFYNLSLNYAFNKETKVWVGRKINPKLSSVGAVDGIQLEKKLGRFSAGAILGSRPDYSDYSYNAQLFQAGAYLAHYVKTKMGFLQSTLAIVDQENKWNTDRRFLYIQHANSLVKDLYFFASGEMDLYEKIEGIEKNTFKLTNAYLSLRYRIRSNLRLSASYSARNNIIYYETYKNFIDKLLEYESLQGFRFSTHYRPWSKVSVGFRAGYRYRKEDDKPTRNLYTYATFSRIPLLDISATLSATLLETSYINGNVYALYLSKDLLKGKLSGGLIYRYTDYAYSESDLSINQHSGELSLVWRVMKKLSLSLNNEIVFESDRTYDRLYLSLSQRL